MLNNRHTHTHTHTVMTTVTFAVHAHRWLITIHICKKGATMNALLECRTLGAIQYIFSLTHNYDVAIGWSYVLLQLKVHLKMMKEHLSFYLPGWLLRQLRCVYLHFVFVHVYSTRKKNRSKIIRFCSHACLHVLVQMQYC